MDDANNVVLKKSDLINFGSGEDLIAFSNGTISRDEVDRRFELAAEEWKKLHSKGTFTISKIENTSTASFYENKYDL